MDSNLFFSFTTTLLIIIFFHVSYFPLPSFSLRIYSEFIYPNFTTSNLQYVSNTGAFLTSQRTTFKAAIIHHEPSEEVADFYFSIIHVESNQIIWSANRDSPISNSDKFSLTSNGFSLVRENGQRIWSTPPFNSSVRALQLQESGNLVLIDNFNRTIWQSFDHPTDTIVVGQRLPVGTLLLSGLQNNVLTGNYSFMLIDHDAVLQWNSDTYWKISMDTSTFKDKNSPVAYLMLNGTGLYLCGYANVVVFQVILNYSTAFRVAQLNYDGRFTIKSFLNKQWTQEFVGPQKDCLIPNFCGAYGLCTEAVAGSNSGTCTCPSGFRSKTGTRSCLPPNASSLPPACGNGTRLSSSQMVSYEELSTGIDYFSNAFSTPILSGQDLLACANICSRNCSCLGYFYENSSGSCYPLNNQLGSFLTVDGQTDRKGYIKTIVSANNKNEKKGKNPPIVALVLIPTTAVSLLAILIVVGLFAWRKSRSKKTKEVKLGRPSSNNSVEIDTFSIPGLPVRFDYEELDKATNNFQNKIGSGGFGDVYKGTLSDKTTVAVKKITNSSNQGKKEFCTEIAIIGNIHHVNLVKLRGFCAQGRQRLLVYEYMSRGSLDRTLFGSGPVLEWQERFEIAMGTARGLAYLHSGCEQKIIHCDVKPENILLNDHFQVKISDFGLSKLLSPEQSSHFTTMRGTRGYLAPEWLTSSAISDKTDVYSFGMVLLEIVSGRKNCSTKTQTHSIEIDSGSGGDSSSSTVSIPLYFPLYALEMHEERRYKELADPKLEGRVRNEEVEMLVRVALCCVHEDPSLRPSMANVVSMMEGGIPLGTPRVEGLNFLRFYGRRFTEASNIEGSNVGNVFALFPQAMASSESTTTGSYGSLSYMSSQQVSGPR
ncbi:hypothetical protein AQUCO_01700531v1 [Aquilegia coerulea]|uniref:Receptor-like serine/threonine-protein kinase n=1 Tax=Aquilegia coerulea TaxID=218851 RepID=A0A2G5DNG3_AQUCA|nr:hypothetical protein AQUCO_01700531v1 [Aquilegia coerulea]